MATGLLTMFAENFGKTAAAGAVTGLGAANTLWKYNRSCYDYDADFRLERFCTGYEFACTQMEQFRNDIKKLSEQTQKRMQVYIMVNMLGLAVMIAIFCAGRLGLHGPSPPIYIMGLFLTNIAAAFAFAITGITLALHASWRAQAAKTSLLTRRVRLPIPTKTDLDHARKFRNQFEHQRWADIFRIPFGPFVERTPNVDDEAWVTPGEERGKQRSHSAPPAGRRPLSLKKGVYSWVGEEWAQDKSGIPGKAGMKEAPANVAPEHFHLFAEVQKEWYQHDMYCRLCFFLAWITFFQGCGFYGNAQIIIELRAFWPAMSTSFILATLQAIILKHDIVIPTNTDRPTYLPYCEFAGPLALIFGGAAMELDFRVEYSPAAIAMTWVLVYIAYLLQILYSFRLIEAVLPSCVKLEEKLGDAFWPADWPIPATFQHVMYLVFPPKYMRPGQVDTVRELREGVINKKNAGESAIHGDDSVSDKVAKMEALFDWWHQRAWGRISDHAKDEVQREFSRFQAAVKKGGQPLIGVINNIVVKLESLASAEKIGAPNMLGTSEGEGYTMSSGKDGEGKPGEAASSGEKHVVMKQQEVWRIPLLIISTYSATWIFLFATQIIDTFLGTQALVTAPHWAYPPLNRGYTHPPESGTPMGLTMYSGEVKWTPEEMYWHENFERPETWLQYMNYGHESDRRLRAQSRTTGTQQHQLRDALKDLLTAFPSAATAGDLLKRPATEAETQVLSDLAVRHQSGPLRGLHPQDVAWPGFFEPHLLACEPAHANRKSVVLAITPRGAAVAHELSFDSQARKAATETFSLSGLAEFPPLISASWSTAQKGLMLVSRAGHLLSCPGARPQHQGQWACGPLTNAPQLVPLAEGGRLVSATAAWLRGPDSSDEPRLHVAIVVESSPELVSLWSLEGNTKAASWLPLGELPVPHSAAGASHAKPSLAFVDNGDLLVAAAGGSTIQRRILDGSVVKSAPAAWEVTAGGNAKDMSSPGKTTRQWRAACGLHGSDGGVAHLAMHRAGSSHTWHPEMVVTHVSNEVEINI